MVRRTVWDPPPANTPWGRHWWSHGARHLRGRRLPVPDDLWEYREVRPVGSSEVARALREMMLRLESDSWNPQQQ